MTCCTVSSYLLTSLSYFTSMQLFGLQFFCLTCSAIVFGVGSPKRIAGRRFLLYPLFITILSKNTKLLKIGLLTVNTSRLVQTMVCVMYPKDLACTSRLLQTLWSVHHLHHHQQIILHHIDRLHHLVILQPAVSPILHVQLHHLCDLLLNFVRLQLNLKYERAWFKREGMRFNLTIFLKDIWYWRGKWYFYILKTFEIYLPIYQTSIYILSFCSVSYSWQLRYIFNNINLHCYC